MSTILGLDYGEVRIGVAVSDEDRRYSFARPAIITRDTDEQVAQVKILCQTERVADILIGLPLNLSGAPTAQTETVKRFGDRLANETGITVHYRDERLTTAGAKRVVGDDRSGKLDSLVAQQLLEDYLLQQP